MRLAARRSKPAGACPVGPVNLSRRSIVGIAGRAGGRWRPASAPPTIYERCLAWHGPVMVLLRRVSRRKRAVPDHRPAQRFLV